MAVCQGPICGTLRNEVHLVLRDWDGLSSAGHGAIKLQSFSFPMCSGILKLGYINCLQRENCHPLEGMSCSSQNGLVLVPVCVMPKKKLTLPG